MISFNNNKSFGVVLQVYDDYLKVINNEGNIQNVKIQDINKKFQKDNRASCIDSRQNTLHIDNVVKCVSGRYQARKGAIRFIVKSTLFLWDKEFYQTNGLFVESSRNVQILGDEHIKEGNAGAVGGVNKRFRDKLLLKDVVIMCGEWKGYRGRVVNIDDK